MYPLNMLQIKKIPIALVLISELDPISNVMIEKLDGHRIIIGS